jgi:hypothetical protein
MARRSCQHDLLVGDGGGREAVWHGGAGQRHVDLVGVDEAEQLVHIRGLSQGDRDLGEAAVPLTDDRGEHRHAQALGAGQPQHPTGRFTHRTCRPHSGRGRLDRPPGIRDGGPPGGGERDAPGFAAEQQRPRLAFKRSELMGDGGLRRVQQPRCLRDRPGVGDRDEALQRPKRSHS